MLAAGGRVQRALAMTIATIGALGAMAAAPSPSTAATDDREPAVAAVDPVLAADQDLVVEVSVGAAATDDLDVDVLVSPRALSTRTALTQWLDGTSSPALVAVATATIPAGSSSVDVTVPADDLPWAPATDGAMLLAADVEDIDDSLRSLVTLDLPAGGPTRLATSMPSTTPATESGLLSAEELEDAVGPGGILGEQLAIAERGVAFGIDPIVPASIAALGDDAPDAAVAWLDATRALPQTSALPYGGADPVTLARANTAIPTLAGVPDATGAVLPATLAEVPTTLAPVVDATASSLDADLLRTITADATVVVDTDDLDEPLDRLTPSAHVTLDGASVLAADAELQRLVREAVAADPSSSDGIARVMALLATITREAPSMQRTLVATIPTDADPAAALALQEAIGSVAWVEPATIADALADPARDGDLVPSDATGAEEAAAARVASIVGSAGIAESVATTLADPATLVAPVRLQALAAIAATSRDDDADADDRFAALVAPFRAPVTIVEGGDTTLLGSPTDLQVTLENTLDLDVTVLLSGRTGTNAITMPDEPIEAVVPAGGRVRVPIPVDVVAAGDGVIRLEVRTGEDIVLDTATLRISAQPTFEVILLVVVSIAAALLLGFGILRSVRKRRAGTARGDIDPRTEQLAVADARDATGRRDAAAPTETPGAR